MACCTPLPPHVREHNLCSLFPIAIKNSASGIFSGGGDEGGGRDALEASVCLVGTFLLHHRADDSRLVLIWGGEVFSRVGDLLILTSDPEDILEDFAAPSCRCWDLTCALPSVSCSCVSLFSAAL